MPKRIEIQTTEEYDNIVFYLSTSSTPILMTRSEKKKLKRKVENLVLFNNRIFVRRENSEPLEFLPDFDQERKTAIINELHMRSHRGLNSLFRELNQKYYNIKKDEVSAVLLQCPICSQRTIEITNQPTRPIIILQKLQRFQVDITYMQEYEASNNGFKYILNIIDCNSKFAWSYPCLNKTANEVYLHLEDLFLKCFVPKELQSDNGTEFRNNKISFLCHKFKIRQIFGRPYHPESQGVVERFNFTIKRMLLSVMSSERTLTWIHLLKTIVYECNIKYNRAINKSPVKELVGYNGFNVDSNLLIDSYTPEFGLLTEAELDEIERFRREYYLEISQTNRRVVVRRGLGLPEVSENNEEV